MEYAKSELVVIEKTAAEAFEKSLQDLSEMHLALIGGGVGEVIVG